MAQQQLKMAETEHRLHGREDAQCWEAGQGVSQGQEDDDHQGKRSVVARVKDKARRLKNSLRRKKNEDNVSPRDGGISLAEEEQEEEEEEPEYHGAPMYESTTIPQQLAETPSPATPCSSTVASSTTPKEPLTIQQPGKSSPIASKGQHTEFPRDLPSEQPATPEADHSDRQTLAGNVKEILTPAYNMITSATQVIASKIQGNPESIDSPNAISGELGAKQAYDNDVSVKQYLMEKLQPGEDERVLSQVITESITPRAVGGGDGGGAGKAVVGAVEKIKGAVSSLVGKADITDDSASARDVVSPAKMHADLSGEEIPVSTTPFSRQSFLK